MDKFLKDLFSKSPKNKGRKNKRNKNLLPKQVTSAIIATIFLIVVVLFSTNINTILDFFGVRADQASVEISLDPPEGPPGDPPIGPTQSMGPNDSYTYNLNVKSIWGTKLSDPISTTPYLPFKGEIDFLIPDLVSQYPEYIADVTVNVIESPGNTAIHDPATPRITITDSSNDCPVSILPCNWRPTSTFDGEFANPVIEITINTTDYDPLSIPPITGLDIAFNIDATVFYNPYMDGSPEDIDDPKGNQPTTPAYATINLTAGPSTNPDFDMEIIDPVDPAFPEGPTGERHHRNVDAGITTTYDIEISTNEYFATDGFGDIDFSSAELLSAKSSPDSGVLDYYFIPNPFMAGPSDPYDETTPDVILTIITDPSISATVSFPFSIWAETDQGGSFGGGGGPGMYLVNERHWAKLTVNATSPDFYITLGDMVPRATFYSDELLRDVVVPGSFISYDVTLNRVNGFEGDVSASSISLDNNWPTEIASYEFDNGGLFVFQTLADIVQQARLTIYITDTIDTQVIDITDFTIDGYGDIDGDSVLEHRESNPKTFSIVDYTITILNTPQTVGAGTDAIYTIVITPENRFNDSLYLTVIENLIALYPEHIIGVDLNPLPINISADDVATNRDLIIHTNPSSLGTALGGIPFHVQGDSVGLERHVESNTGILNITNQKDFTIQVTPIKNRIIPGGEATYTVTATGILGFNDPIDLSTSWDIPNMPSYISDISFDNTVIIPDDPTGTILHVTTTPTAPPIGSEDPEGQFRVIGTSSIDITMSRFADADLDIVDFSIQITDPAPDLNGDSIRTIASGDETTYIATVTRMNDLTEDIVLSTDLVSVNGSINSLVFEGAEVNYVGGEYILQYSTTLIQLITLRITTFNPIPAETINFYIYGNTITDEGDAFGRQSNRGILNITNDYGFSLLIDPATRTVAPTGIATYTIRVVRLNNFTGDITIVSDITELNGEQVVYNFDKTILTVDAGDPNSDIAILTITANAGALGKQIPFTVTGHADLFGIGNVTYNSVNAEIVIIDFTISITNSPQNIGPGNTIQYIVHLQATGTTTFSEDIYLTTNINNPAVDTYDIIETAWFAQPIISGVVNSVTGLDVILNVKAFNTISSSVPNHSIAFTVYGDATVDTVLLQKSDTGLLNFNNTPYFTLTVTPPIVYSFPGDIAQFDVHIDRYFNYPGQINLNLTSLLSPLIDISYFTIGGQVRSNLLDNENDAILNIVVTEDLLILRDYLHQTSGNDDMLVIVSGTGIYDNAYNTDTAILRIRDFTIDVRPVNTNETYPSSNIQYEVILTRYNTYAGYDEDINLTSDVYRFDTIDHIMPFNATIDFSNNGIFPADTGSGSATMTISTTSKNDDLPTTVNFDVFGAGATTNLTRQDSNYLNIVAVPEFTLNLTPVDDGSGIPTETVDYTITLTREPGFIDDVTISDISIVDGLGQTLTQATSRIQGNNYIFSGADTSRELYIDLADATNYWGDYIVIITGRTTGINDKYANAPLIVMDFAVSLTDNSKTVTPDSSATYEIILDRYNGYDREVVASTSLTSLIGGGDIADVGFDLSNDIFPGTTNLQQITLMTVYTTPTASEQVINFTITGTDNTPTALQRITNGMLNIISSPDYNLILTAKNGIDSGMPTERVTYVVTLESLNDFIGDVTITDVLLSDESDITISWLNDDNILSGISPTEAIELQLDLGTNIAYGNRTVQVRGSGSPGVRDSNIANLSIFDFSILIDAPKNQTITDIEPNNVATYGITLVRHNGYGRTVTVITDLTPANYPGVISSSVFENGGTFGASETTTNLIVYAENSAPTINFDVTGTDAPTGLTRTDSGSLTINDGVTPDYLINISPSSRTIEPGGATTYIVSVTRFNGWTDTVTLTTDLLIIDNRVELAEFDITDLPDGVNEATLSVMAKIDATSSTTPTTFNVFANSAGTQRLANADLIIYKEEVVVIPPGGGGSPSRDFSITIDPNERTVLAGDTTTYTVIINRTNFTDDILLSNLIATDPNIKSATLDQTVIDNNTPETILTVVTEAGATSSTVPIIINGTAIINSQEVERNGEGVLYIRREEEEEKIVFPEEELPSTGPASTLLLIGLMALLLTMFVEKPEPKDSK